MKKTLKVVVILLILVGCRKDKLVGDYNILEGKWKWTYSIKRTYNTVFQTAEFDTIYAAQYPNTYEVEFLHKGKLYVKKNGSVEEKYRIVFNYFLFENKCGYLKSDAWRFGAKLNNRVKYPYNGCVNQDTLTCTNKNLPDDLIDYNDYPYEIGYSHFYLRN